MQDKLLARTDELAEARRCGAAAERALQEEVARLAEEKDAAEVWLAAMHRSTSWRVTRPLRQAIARVRRTEDRTPPHRVPSPPEPPPPAPDVVAEPLTAAAASASRQGHRRSVHQFHSGSAVGDAITNAMILTQGLLRRLGYDSRIFVQHRDPALATVLQTIDDLPDTDDYVLIVRHSMGHDVLPRILALPAPKILLYHNITPAELLDDAHVRQWSRTGREQLVALRPAVVAALADSAYNALELMQAGFDPVFVSTLLFDVAAMQARAPQPARGPVFTILFVGRISAAKGQRELVAAFAQFRTLYAGPSPASSSSGATAASTTATSRSCWPSCTRTAWATARSRSPAWCPRPTWPGATRRPTCSSRRATTRASASR